MQRRLENALAHSLARMPHFGQSTRDTAIMEPGFLSLFSRSLYRGTASRLRDLEPESEEYRRVHEERERFAAAAIAFCLKHSDKSRRHFWEKICKAPDDPEQMPPIPTNGIFLEPAHWADLRLISEAGGER